MLATWRVTHLLANEDGPADLIVRFRARLGSGLLGRLMDCFYCLSLWVAAPFAFFVADSAVDRIVAWLALSGGACLAERIVKDPPPVSRTFGQTEGDEDYAMLRPEAGSAEELRPDNGGPGAHTRRS